MYRKMGKIFDSFYGLVVDLWFVLKLKGIDLIKMIDVEVFKVGM